MLTTSNPATTEGLPAMNRRRFLAGAPVAAVALSIPAIAIATEPTLSIDERIADHLNAIMDLMKERFPDYIVQFYRDDAGVFGVQTCKEGATTPIDRAEYYLKKAGNAMRRQTPGVYRWEVNHATGTAMVVRDSKEGE